jgi:3-dehydroquinate synthase
MTIRASRFEYRVDFVKAYGDAMRQELLPTDYLIVDENVLRHHESLRLCVQSFPHIVITASEEAKSFTNLTPVIDELIRRRFTKTNRLVAIGGGVVQDITAFVASILFRGVDWLFFPTTLLAQCDSCIGSKTSINFGPYKNQLGSFFPPRKVFIDLSFLETLDARDVRSVLGEMMHYFLVNGEDDLAWAEGKLGPALHDGDARGALIRRSLEIKKEMVERDEFDEGPRNVFNYGHSFGHALESTSDYAVPHGVAVSFGMDMANCVSSRQRLLPMSTRNRVRSVLARVWEGTTLPAVDDDAFVAALSRDKKNEGMDVKVILTKGLGQMFKTTLRLDPETRQFLSRYFRDRLYDRDL